jgi:hypothetical protein
MSDSRECDDEVDCTRTLMLAGCRERRLQDPRTVEDIIGFSDERERREQYPLPLPVRLTPPEARRTSISTAWQMPIWPRSINASDFRENIPAYRNGNLLLRRCGHRHPPLPALGSRIYSTGLSVACPITGIWPTRNRLWTWNLQVRRIHVRNTRHDPEPIQRRAAGQTASADRYRHQAARADTLVSALLYPRVRRSSPWQRTGTDLHKRSIGAFIVVRFTGLLPPSGHGLVTPFRDLPLQHPPPASAASPPIGSKHLRERLASASRQV